MGHCEERLKDEPRFIKLVSFVFSSPIITRDSRANVAWQPDDLIYYTGKATSVGVRDMHTRRCSLNCVIRISGGGSYILKRAKRNFQDKLSSKMHLRLQLSVAVDTFVFIRLLTAHCMFQLIIKYTYNLKYWEWNRLVNLHALLSCNQPCIIFELTKYW